MNRPIVALLVLAVAVAARAAGDGELLAPQQAFRLEVHAVSPSMLVAQWHIANGYYLYRKRIRFSTSTPGFSLGAPRFPASSAQDDPYFGRTEIYRGELRVPIPLRHTTAAGLTLQLTVHSQGCAELGACYPPQIETRRVAVIRQAASASDTTDPLAALGVSGAAADRFLPPDQAFKISARALGSGRIRVSWEIAAGYYLYRASLHFTVRSPQSVRLKPPQLPAGTIKQDPYFGREEVYYHHVAADLRLLANGQTLPPRITLDVTYQGCSAAGLCYTSQHRQLSLGTGIHTEADPHS